MTDDIQRLKRILEGAILAAGEPLTVDRMLGLFEEHELPEKEAVKQALTEIQESCDGRGFQLVEVASGWRFIVREDIATWVNRLWEEKPQKYSRALLETLALIAYRQPLTRGDIEEVRGVAVSSHIIKTLTEREWVKVVGHRDVPGRPSLFATTKKFLDYFNLNSLEQLPSLGELKDIGSLNKALDFEGQPPLDESEVAAIENPEDNSEEGSEVSSEEGAKEGSEDKPEGSLEEKAGNSSESNSDEDAETISEGPTESDSSDNIDHSENADSEEAGEDVVGEQPNDNAEANDSEDADSSVEASDLDNVLTEHSEQQALPSNDHELKTEQVALDSEEGEESKNDNT